MKLKRSSLYNIGIFLILLIAFTKSLYKTMYGGNSGAIVVMIVGCVLILISCLLQNKGVIRPSFNKMDVLWIIVLIIATYNNYDIKNDNLLPFVQLFIGTFLVIFLKSDDNWCEKAIKYVKFFTMFYLITGVILLIFKGFLISYIVPLFNLHTSPEYYSASLLSQINSGFMTGLTSHYSTMGIYMSIGMIFFAGELFTDRDRIKPNHLIVVLVMLIGVLLSGKRSALIFPLCAVLIVYMLYFKPRNLKRRINYFLIFFLVLSFAILIIGLLPESGGTISRLVDIFGDKDLNVVTNKRYDMLWLPAILLFLDAPLLGIGWGNFKYSFTIYYPYTANQNNAHNVYLQLLSETGIVGTTIIMIAIFYTLYVTASPIHKWRNKQIKLENKKLMALGISLTMQIYFLLYSLSGNPLYDINCYLLYMLSIAMSAAVNFSIKNSYKKGKNNEIRSVNIS